MQLPSLQASQLFGELRKKSIRSVERTGWLSRQTKSKLMQKLATTKVRSQLLFTSQQKELQIQSRAFEL